jgi:hypothetical protein
MCRVTLFFTNYSRRQLNYKSLSNGLVHNSIVLASNNIQSLLFQLLKLLRRSPKRHFKFHTLFLIWSHLIVFNGKTFYNLLKSFKVKKPVINCIFFENLGQEILLKSISIFPWVPHNIVFSAEDHEVGDGELVELLFVFFECFEPS